MLIYPTVSEGAFVTAVWAVIGIVLTGLVGNADAQGAPIHSERVDFVVETIAQGVRQPTALVFLPDGRGLLVGRADAVVKSVDLVQRSLTSMDGVPKAVTGEDAGLHDLVLHCA